MNELKAGETRRFTCPDCSVEFDLTYEPNAAGKPKEAAVIDPAFATNCPFCTATLEETEGTDETDEWEGDELPPADTY